MLDLPWTKSSPQERFLILALAGITVIYVAGFAFFIEKGSVRGPVYDLMDW